MNDFPYDLTEALSQVRERLEAAVEAVPEDGGPLVERLSERILDPKFTYQDWKDGFPGDTVKRVAQALGHEPGRSSFLHWRMAAASEALLRTRAKVWQVAELVGYPVAQSFCRAFSQCMGETPSAFVARRDPLLAAAQVDERSEGFWVRTAVGALAPHELARCRLLLGGGDSELPSIELHLGETREAEERTARELWEMLRTLPREERRVLVRDVLRPDSPAFYRLLVAESHAAGREDPDRGVELAQLALDHLAAGEQTFGQEVRELAPFTR